jgi:Ser-tRNA(Ala) deacylase AlaX
MHTAGHLLAATTQAVYPALIPFHGNHDPKDGYVKFRISMDIPINEEEIKSRIQPLLNQKIQEDLPIMITQDSSGLRAIQIGDSVMTCGGTHVPRLSAVGSIIVKDLSPNKKENTLTIKYRL